MLHSLLYCLEGPERGPFFFIFIGWRTSFRRFANSGGGAMLICAVSLQNPVRNAGK